MTETLVIIFQYLLISVALMVVSLPFIMNCRIYYPSKQLFAVDINYENIFIPVEKNVNINAWYSPPGNNDITVLFCHGNGGNLSFYSELIGLLQSKGYGVMAIDYRGYGESTGKPSENGLYKDLRATVDYLRENKNTPKEKLVLWGFSLGGAIVAQIASECPEFRGIILQSTFTSVREMGSYLFHKVYLGIKSDYKSFLTDKFIKNFVYIPAEYKTDNKISKIKSRLLLAHATPDNIVPFEMCIKLADLNPRAEVFISSQGGHNDHSWFYPRLFKFLETL